MAAILYGNPMRDLLWLFRLVVPSVFVVAAISQDHNPVPLIESGYAVRVHNGLATTEIQLSKSRPLPVGNGSILLYTCPALVDAASEKLQQVLGSASNAATARTWDLILDLPIELRYRIWRFATPHRVLEWDDTHGVIIRSIGEVSSAVKLRQHPEAKAVLEYSVFPHPLRSRLTYVDQSRTRARTIADNRPVFSFSHDIFFFLKEITSPTFHSALENLLGRPLFDSVQYIAIPFRGIVTLAHLALLWANAQAHIPVLNVQHVNVLTRMPNLKMVFIMYDWAGTVQEDPHVIEEALYTLANLAVAEPNSSRQPGDKIRWEYVQDKETLLKYWQTWKPYKG